MDRFLQLKYNEMEVDNFRITARPDYPDLFHKAIRILLLFVTQGRRKPTRAPGQDTIAGPHVRYS